MIFEAYVASRDGTKRASLQGADWDKVVWRLYPEIGSCHFTLPVTHYAMREIAALDSEVQIYVHGNLVWVGTVNRDTTDFSHGDIQCEELMWWWQHRIVGRANRINKLVNGSFDSGALAPWQAVGVTANIVDGWGFRPGTYQLNLNQSGSGEDTFVRQHFQNDLAGRTLWTVSAWYHIRTDSDWLGPATEERGLYIENFSEDSSTLLDVRADKITEQTERGQYLNSSLTIFSKENEHLWVRLYAIRTDNSAVSPAGGIIWDNVKLVAMESLSFSRADLRDIVAGVIAHAQDSAYGKSDLNIGTQAALTGLILDKAWQFEDHPKISDVLRDMIEAGLCDLDMVYSNQGATRQVKVYSPSKGNYHPEFALEIGRHLIDVKRVRDGTQVKNSIISTGQGEGPARDEGYASDTSQSFGIVMEDVVTAPEGTPYDLLANAAEAALSSGRNPENIPVMVVNEETARMIGTVGVGDTVPVRATFAPGVAINGTFRIIEMSLDPKSEEMEVTVNP